MGTALGQRATEIGGFGCITARDVARLAQAGDATARRLLAEEARHLSIGFANLLHLYAPEMIVVGGGVSDCLPAMRADIEAVVRRQAMPAYRDVPIVAAALGHRAGIIGASLLV